MRSALLALALVACGPLRAQKVTATVVTGPNPFAIAVNPVTNKIYVVNDAASGSVTVVDGVTNATAAVTAGTNPVAIDVNTVTNRIYVANSGSNNVTVIDGATNSTATVAVGVNPDAIAVNPVTNKVYVLDRGSSLFGDVTVIDGATNSTSTTATGSYPQGGAIVVNPVTDKIYFLNNTITSDPNTLNPNPTLTEIDGATNATSHLGPIGFASDSLALDTATNRIYVPNVHVAAGILECDLAQGTYSIFGAGETGYGAVVVNPVTNKVYVMADNGLTFVTEVDGATNATTLIPVGKNPAGLCVNPVTDVVYVADFDTAGTVTVIDGATNATSTIAVGANPFAVAVNPATNKVYVLGSGATGTLWVIDGVPGSVPPSITSGPQALTVSLGASAVFSIAAVGRPVPAYRWSFNGAPLADAGGISGSTSPTLYLAGGAGAASAGAYACTVTNGAGSATSAPATLTVVDSPDPGRIVNLSTRAWVTNGGFYGSNPLIAGFVVGGQGSKPLVLRGIGPTLASFGLSAALDAPALSLYDSASPANLISEDIAWQAPPSPPASPWSGKVAPLDATGSDFASVGAFTLAPGSADSAMKVTLPAGAYTSQITETGTGEGVALAEVYDADAGNPGAQLVNVSSRSYVATGNAAMIAGFVISGSTAQTILVRASGPALGAFGVPQTLPDPELQVFDARQNLVASSIGWGGNPQVALAAARVGAFAWANPSSQDSAILITLPPGNYTAQVSALTGDQGNALVEVYAVK